MGNIGWSGSLEAYVIFGVLLTFQHRKTDIIMHTCLYCMNDKGSWKPHSFSYILKWKINFKKNVW